MGDETDDLHPFKSNEVKDLEEKFLKQKKYYEHEIKRKETALSLFIKYIDELRNENMLLNKEMQKHKSDIVQDGFTQTDEVNIDNKSEEPTVGTRKNPKRNLKKEKQVEKKKELFEKIVLDQKLVLEHFREKYDQLIDEHRVLCDTLHQRDITLAEEQRQRQYYIRTCRMLESEASAFKRTVRDLTYQNRRLKSRVSHIFQCSIDNANSSAYTRDQNLETSANYTQDPVPVNQEKA